MNSLSIALLLPALFTLAYEYLLLLVAVRPPLRINPSSAVPLSCAVVIPAHDEEAVIARAVASIFAAGYPGWRCVVHVVADHCADDTARVARQAGAFVHVRNDGVRGGKGEALGWLLSRVLVEPQQYDAVVVFDADTQVESDFFKVMSVRLAQGAQVVQGNHIISNPRDGWFPALTWAMFLVDNRIQNYGRARLGWSARNMGDSICFRADVLARVRWGEGLTDDYQLRQRLLLEGIRIAYEPSARGYGEAPPTWAAARAQRARWLSGTWHVSHDMRGCLLRAGLRRRDAALLDGAAQAFLSSYSTLTFISVGILLLHLLVSNIGSLEVTLVWLCIVAAQILYPLGGLVLERAPLRAYLVILTGPVYIIWRTVLSVSARLRQPTPWVRTVHRTVPDSDAIDR